jgi:TetR/AcrR family transcriptional repressor of nem operon
MGMKRSKADTAETRKRIIKTAAQAFKTNGIEGTGVAEIMAAAGLSHGGFYRHFSSKEQLIAEACASEMDHFVCMANESVEPGAEAFIAHIEKFLSAEYRDDKVIGCPIVAMGSELARADADTRHAVSRGYEELIEIVTKWLSTADDAAARDDAMFTLSSMVGAMTMSRITDNPALSDYMLVVAKKRLAQLLVQRQNAAKPAVDRSAKVRLAS